MKARLVSESINFERGQDPRDIMNIGDPKARAERKLQSFADKMGWDFYKTPRGIWTLTTPLDIEVAHNMESTGGYKGTYDYGSFQADSLRYKVSWQEGSWGTLISLRKVYMQNGKEVKQNKMDDFAEVEDVIKRIELNYPKELRKAGITESLEFNFKQPPYKRYQSSRGISHPPVENPRKKAQGLTPEEQEIVQRHEEAISRLKEQIDDLEDGIQEYKYEIEKLEDYGPDPGEMEQFDSDIIQRFGWNALDLLNSGASKDEKIKELDRLDPKNDSGLEDFQSIIRDYDYYHPPEPDNEEEIQGFQDQIEIREKEISEIEERIEKLETKIYNLEHY